MRPWRGGRSTYSILSRCRSDAAHIARPEGRFKCDVRRLSPFLIEAGHALVKDAGALLLFESPQAVEFSLFENGKVLVKTGDRATAERIVGDVERAISSLLSSEVK